MSDSSAYTGRASVSMETEITEVQGIFASDAALQDAIGRLMLLGFDRAAISLPHASSASSTPEQSASDPNTDDDNRQVRTLGTSMAATVGAFAAAGAVVATGGLALPAVAAAVAGGLGAGGLVHATANASNAAQSEARDEEAARGELLLAVKVTDASQQDQAITAMREAGADRAEAVRRVASCNTMGNPVSTLR